MIGPQFPLLLESEVYKMLINILPVQQARKIKTQHFNDQLFWYKV